MNLLLVADLNTGDAVETSLDQFFADNPDLDAAGGVCAESIRECIALAGLVIDGGGASPAWALGTPHAIAELLAEGS